MSEIGALAKALVKASKEIENPHLDGVGNFKNKFASLRSTLDAIRPVYAKHGLAVVQMFVPVEGGIGVKAVIIHDSGESLDCGTFQIPVAQCDAQKYCSATTYARRFSLQALACVTGEKDDDGQEAVEKPAKQAPKKEVSAVDKAFLATCKDAAKVLGISPRTLRYKLARLKEQGVAIPAVG